MVAIPTLRCSENSPPPLSAVQESGRRFGRDDYWAGQWVPRDERGVYTGQIAYYNAEIMRREYPGIVLFQDGEVYHDN